MILTIFREAYMKNSGGSRRGREGVNPPCHGTKKIQKKMATIDGHFDFMFLSEVYRSQWRIQDFRRGGGANSPGGRQHTILPNFPKNCMKLKEFGPPGERVPRAPP